jgi:hypothetical protein
MAMENEKRPNKIKLDSYFYFTICKDNYKRFIEYEREISLILAGESESLISKKLKVFNPQREMAKCAANVVIFAAFSLEAWIYEYTVKKLSKSFFDNHIDKLRPVSKWVIVTRLVTGRDFPTDSQAFEHLKSLYKARNDLVHPKPSTQPEDTEESLEKEEKEREQLIKNAHEAYQTCKEVILELDKVENNGRKSEWAKQVEAIVFGDV